MTRYIVTVKEIWNQEYTVYADSEEEEAIKLVELNAHTGDIDAGVFEINMVMDSDNWDVRED